MKDNFVAKNAHKFNRANVMVDRKKAAKSLGTSKTRPGIL